MRHLLAVLWAALLAGLFIVSFGLLAGHSSGGGMRVDYSLFILLLTALPVLAGSPRTKRLPWGTDLHRYVGYAIGAMALWWLFWLPASLQGMATSARYGADNHHIAIPATADVQVAVLCVVAWLVSGSDRYSVVLVWLALSAAALVGADTALQWAMTYPGAATWCLSIASSLSISRALVAPASSHWRLALGLSAALSALVGIWSALYHWGDQLPQFVNRFGASLI